MSLLRAAARLMVVIAAASSAACSQMSFFLANAPAMLGSYRRTANLAYGTDSRHRLDIYTPDKAANRPVVVFWYGGAWTEGGKSDYRFVGAALAERGFVTVLPDYRLSPAVRFPEFMDDAANAVAWVQRHIAQYGGDPRRIVLMGHSAGAYMASLLALDDRFLVKAGARRDSIRGFIGLSGPYALVPNTDSLRTIFAAPYSPADWQPVEYVTPRAPPALLIHGDADTLVYPGHAEKLRDALTRAGVPAELELLAGRGHADPVAAIALVARYRAPVLAHSVRFIESVTTPPVTSTLQTDPSL